MQLAGKASLLKCLFVIVFLAMGCEVTGEKIALWKGTQNGPKKLAGVMIDPEQPMDLRTQAAIALIEINQRELFNEAFRKIDEADSEELILAMAPVFGKRAEGPDGNNGLAEKSLAKSQVDAKDGLYLMLEYAGEKSRPVVEEHLVNWCTQGNFNIRAMAGYNVKIIAKKLGGPAAVGLASILTIDQMAILPIAKLIRELDDSQALSIASSFLAKQLGDNPAKVAEVHLTAAATIGGEPIGNVLLGFATNAQLSAELQRLALRAFSVALDQGHIVGTVGHAGLLFEMAENGDFDKYQREETYMTIAQIGGKGTGERLAKLLSDRDFFWRLVGTRCLLRLDGDLWLGTVLETKRLARKPAEVKDMMQLVARFPKLRKSLRTVLSGRDSFATGVAVGVLATTGIPDKDVPLLEKLVKNKKRLPAGFGYRTIGEAAEAAIDELKKKG